MAIADNVLGRLVRFNAARGKAGDREPGSFRRGLGAVLLRGIGVLRWMVVLAILALIGWGVHYEMRTSYLEAWIFTRLDRGMSFAAQPGPSEAIRFPKHGPYDERLGYVALPKFTEALEQRHFTVERQSRWSKGLDRFVGFGAFPIYAEKDRAGLRIFDRNGDEVYGTRFPLNAFRDYASIPPLVVNSLLFIEDRYLFDNRYPEHNAAVEWNRFALAVFGRVLRFVVPGFNEGGASTLATQIEKFRHSPNGLTGGVGEKLRQMLTASAHVYINGANTMDRRREIVTTYLNSTPLSSFPGYGEVIGLPDALYVWFSTDFNDAAKVLTGTPKNKKEWARKGEIYRQVLALLLSGRLPSHYLISDREGLGELCDRYLWALYDAGYIDRNLRDATLDAELKYRKDPPPITQVSWVKQKATMETLHQRFIGLKPAELTRIAAKSQDVLTQWAANYMAKASDHSLQAMLDASALRTYSGSPESFFTGGGMQGFGNFDSDENGGSYSVIDAFKHSVNLSFVRILRDIANYYTAENGIDAKRLLDEEDTPEREAYLRRFADADGKRFMWRYYKDFRCLNPDEAMDLLIRHTRRTPRALSAIYLTFHPDARLADFRDYLAANLRGAFLSQEQLWEMYTSLSPEKMSLADRGYVAGIHPLELWLGNYPKDHSGANWNEVVDASADVRQEIYGWLFNGSLTKQDTRIRILIEQDAFQRIWENWRQYGYPFGHLVPSLGTAIGASGDRPDALAELMGVIMNDGVRMPSISIERLRFAEATPYETVMKRSAEPERVMSHEVAEVAKRALKGVVQEGTARRLIGTYKAADGTELPVGGKTGPGDNRYHHFGAGGGITGSRVVDRTGTFVFFLGDRFFGTVTAYVAGPEAARFSFTSGLAVQLLKVLEPELRPLIQSPPAPDGKSVAEASIHG